MNTWADHVIWWQLHPISFVGAEPAALSPGSEPVHRLGHLQGWLDYLVELGCNGLALGPIFASETHGYDTVDHYRIDPRLGEEDDLVRLIDDCHRRGVKVLLDGVFNHVGRGFAPFQDVLARRRESPYASWFRLDFDADGPDGFGYTDFEGHRHLVALNHAEPQVADYVTAVARHWLDRGADGWRLDAAYAVPVEFWHAVTSQVRRTHPHAWFLGEVIHGDYARFVTEGGLDSVTQYELWKAIWSSLNDRNFFELSWALDRHEDFAENYRPLTFVGNHDVTRLASKLDDERHLAHALAVLFTVSGLPSVYAGDEQGFRGVKYERADGDAEIRPAFPGTPAALAPYGWPVYRLHQDLIGLRRRHPWLVRARVKVVHLDNTAFAYHLVNPDGGPGLVVVLNVSDHPFTLPSVSGSARRRLLGSADSGAPEDVGPHGWAVLEVSA
ncbi:alpha-amylase family glycosyl hydrolase [Microbispora sp. NPDC049125]|uniref:alpha-amylase family glycosyl hydrolase n=1 Tax=Microbispora sp. NPDC049125 TaxID=3154929 RepID=UPI0034675D1A